MLAIVAQTMSQEDVTISIMAQGGFLDFAANGSVTYVAANGQTVTQPVSPDPSVPGQNPTGALTWLDVLSDSVYNVQRVGAQYATASLAITNITANTYNLAAGTFHTSNPTNGVGYTNSQALTIAAQNLVGGGVTGATATSPINIATSSAHGLATGQSVTVAGVVGNTAANGTWLVTVVDSTHFALNGSVGSVSYMSGGTVNVCTVATFAADIAGPTGTAAPGSITQLTTTTNGVSVTNLVAFYGQAFESNASVASRCRLKLQSLSPNGPSGAYKYFALSAAQILAAQTPPVQLSSPVTRVLVQQDTVNGKVTTSVANAGGAVSGVSNLAVTGATNAAPIVITTASSHGLSNGAFVGITGVLGNSNANGTWTIASASGSTFSLVGSTGNAAYTSGGVVEGGDLGLVDSVIQAYAVPDLTTAITQSATPWNIAISATVTVPLAYVAAFQAAVQAALAAYFANLPIGGLPVGTLPAGEITGVIFAAGSVSGAPSYVLNVASLLINGSSSSATFPGATSVAVLSPAPTITVTGI